MRRAGLISRYRRAIAKHGEPVLLRRYASSGASRPMFNAEIRATVTGYQPHELIGGIVQGDRKVLILAEDVNSAQFGLPLTVNDKLVIRGREVAIGVIDDNTHRDGATLVAFELKVTG